MLLFFVIRMEQKTHFNKPYCRPLFPKIPLYVQMTAIKTASYVHQALNVL